MTDTIGCCILNFLVLLEIGTQFPWALSLHFLIAIWHLLSFWGFTLLLVDWHPHHLVLRSLLLPFPLLPSLLLPFPLLPSLLLPFPLLPSLLLPLPPDLSSEASSAIVGFVAFVTEFENQSVEKNRFSYP
jgi:hypothetical protein